MTRYSKWLTVAVLLAGIVLRIVWLEADPDYYSWIGFYVDEGRWTAIARDFAHFGTITIDPRNHNAIVAPGFEAVSAVSFQLLGVNHFAARLFPALCGAGLIAALFFYLRRHISTLGVLCGVCVLALQTDLVNLSRVAVPETASMLGSLLTWIAIDAARGRRLALSAAGCVLIATLSFKMTSYLLVPAFVLVVFTQQSDRSFRERLTDVVWFLSGFFVIGLAGLIVLVPRLSAPEELLRRVVSLLTFLEPSSLFGMVARPFESSSRVMLNSVMLVLWLGALAFLAAQTQGSGGESSGDRRRLTGAMIWTATVLLVMTIQSYFPERYVAHVLVPLSLVAAFAVSQIERLGLSGLTARFSNLRNPHRGLLVALIALPSAVVVAPVFSAVLTVAGMDGERFSTKVVAIALASPPVVATVVRWRSSQHAIGTALAFPIATILGWLTVWAWSESGIFFWPTAAPLRDGLLWLLYLALVFCASYASIALSLRRSFDPVQWGGVGAALLWTVAWAGMTVPGIVFPHYSLREAARDLGQRLPPDAEVHQFHADSLFLGNQLDYGLIHPYRLGTDLPRFVVTRFPPDRIQPVLDEHYTLLTHYNLHVSRRYHWIAWRDTSQVCGKLRGFCVGVYERREP